MADAARPLMPSMIDWLDHNGRIAVQAFLVMSGFLVGLIAARASEPATSSQATDPTMRCDGLKSVVLTAKSLSPFKS